MYREREKFSDALMSFRPPFYEECGPRPDSACLLIYYGSLLFCPLENGMLTLSHNSVLLDFAFLISANFSSGLLWGKPEIAKSQDEFFVTMCALDLNKIDLHCNLFAGLFLQSGRECPWLALPGSRGCLGK